MATKQGFHSRVHLYDDLTISVFHFHFPFPVSISAVSNCPLKVDVYLFGDLFILLIITTTRLLGDNEFLQPMGVTMNAL